MWTDQQKNLHYTKLLGSAAVCGILTLVLRNSLEKSLKILSLSNEVSPDVAIDLLEAEKRRLSLKLVK